jgi:hypothetical protein
LGLIGVYWLIWHQIRGCGEFQNGLSTLKEILNCV